MWISSRSWDDIVDGFAALCKHNSRYEPMTSFVQKIRTSPYVLNPTVTVLFPATSMATLLIAATERFWWKTEVVEVSYMPSAQIFQFDYWESPQITEHWSRTSSISNSFAPLERLLHQKRWA